MSAIESSTVGMKTMADGTLRLTLDIEPRFAKAAFGLFGAPGTPCAIAALRIGTPAPAEPEKPKGGPLARLAGQWCNDPKFQAWIEGQYNTWLGGIGPETEFEATPDCAKWCLCSICEITSRAELDHNQLAASAFEVRIRKPYMAHLEACTA